MKNKNIILSYFTAVVIAFCLVALCIFLYANKEASLIGLILGVFLSISAGVAIGLGGFYLIIIPLPYIYIGKAGCVKPNQPKLRKSLCGLLSLICPMLVFVVLFKTQNMTISSFFNSKETNSGEILRTFSGVGLLPAEMLVNFEGDNEIYTLLLGKYGAGSTYKITSGESIKRLKTIHTVNPGSLISEIDADMNYIVWFEETKYNGISKTYYIKLYDRETKTTNTIFEKIIANSSPDFQYTYIGLSGDKVFYLLFDYINSSIKIMEYSITNSTHTTFLEFPLINHKESNNLPIKFINVKESILITSIIEDGINKLVIYHTGTKEKLYSVVIPNTVKIVNYADFDLDNKTFALNYHKKESGEGIGFINSDDQELIELETLSRFNNINEHRIFIADNIVYYNIDSWGGSENFHGVLYKIDDHAFEEIDNAFYMQIVNDQLYSLCMDEKVEYIKIKLIKEPINK